MPSPRTPSQACAAPFPRRTRPPYKSTRSLIRKASLSIGYEAVKRSGAMTCKDALAFPVSGSMVKGIPSKSKEKFTPGADTTTPFSRACSTSIRHCAKAARGASPQTIDAITQVNRP